MGNNYLGKVAQEDLESSKLIIKVNETKYLITQKQSFRIDGQLFLDGRYDFPISIYLKVIGEEKANYDYKKNNNQIHKYQLNNIFYEKKILLNNNSIIYTEQYKTSFQLDLDIFNPSFNYGQENKSILSCSVNYKLRAEIYKKKELIAYEEQELTFHKIASPQIVALTQEELTKVETITTYKYCRTQRIPIFTSLKVDKLQIKPDEDFHVQVFINNCYGGTQIKNAILSLYAEFTLIDNFFFRGMPKLLIQEEECTPDSESQITDTSFIFKIKEQFNIPPQFRGQKIGCRHILVLRIEFYQSCLSVDDIEIIKSIEYFPPENSQSVVTQNSINIPQNLQDALCLQEIVYSKEAYMLEKDLFDERTRIAQNIQVIDINQQQQY